MGAIVFEPPNYIIEKNSWRISIQKTQNQTKNENFEPSHSAEKFKRGHFEIF